MYSTGRPTPVTENAMRAPSAAVAYWTRTSTVQAYIIAMDSDE